jgi:LysM repeat protein
MKQRLLGIAALLVIGGLMAGVPWLFIYVATRLRIRFDLTTSEGWWQAITTRDDGTLLVGLLLILGAIAWLVLAVAILVEIVNRLRGVRVPQLRGFGIPQAIARGLVAAAIGAWLATNTITTGALHAIAAPGPIPVDTGGTPNHLPAAPQAQPEAADDEDDVYVVKKGDTLWDIADDKLGDPYAYPEIFKASKHTVQPDGRRLVDPDLIYPGWELTIPDDDPPEKAAKPKRAAATNHEEHAQTTPEAVPVPATPSVPSTTPSPAGPTASAAPTVESETAAPSQDADDIEDVDETAPLPWMLAGLSGAGALLAGGLWLRLRRRRAVQFRFRRPGRTIAVSEEPALATVEKTLRHQGDITSVLVDRVAQTTQRLAARLHGAGRPIPALLGIDVTEQYLTYRFTDPTELPEPWEPGEDRREWRIPTDTEPDLIGPWDEENEPVWPTLVTVGQDDRGWRMINLETLGVITLTGDQTNAEDLVRYWLAELSVAHWGRDVEITGGELFGELASLIRTDLWPARDDRVGALIDRAKDTDKYLAEYTASGIYAGRAAQAGPELWQPRILITAADEGRLDELADLVASRQGRTGVTIICLGGSEMVATGTEIQVTADGRVRVPDLGLDLLANGITPDEAAGCAALMDDATSTDEPVPDAAEPAAAWQQHCDAAGHLHADLTTPRGTLDAVNATSLLPDQDIVYVTETANTDEDLAELAPLVPAATTALVRASDPSLDQDLADWRADSTDRPRIAVLGPVRLRLGRSGRPAVGASQVAYYAEVAAYLATRPHGATTEELTEALGAGAKRVRVVLHTLRSRLGINPATSHYFLPYASDNPEADARSEGVYLLEDALYDADLFRRLRLRGEAAGAAGMDDLADALRLVTGAPYEQLRRRGGLWLADSRDDQHLLVAVVDVAHVLTTHAVAAGDLRRARAAAELAHAVAPYEATPQLDIAAITEHEGAPAEADRIARNAADWLDGTGDGPLDLSQRADTILRAHRWLDRRDRVS